MFHTPRLNNRINTIHERALRIIYQDYTTSFTDLLAKDNSLTTHHRNLQKLVTEMFKVKAGIPLEIMKDILQIEDKPYHLLHNFFVKSNNVRSVNYCTHMVSFVILEFEIQYPKCVKIQIHLFNRDINRGCLV